MTHHVLNIEEYLSFVLSSSPFERVLYVPLEDVVALDTLLPFDLFGFTLDVFLRVCRGDAMEPFVDCFLLLGLFISLLVTFSFFGLLIFLVGLSSKVLTWVVESSSCFSVCIMKNKLFQLVKNISPVPCTIWQLQQCCQIGRAHV